MRDANARVEAGVRGKPREKLELSLDGRQIASVVVGALVLLGVVFVLGLNVGRQVAARQAEAARAPSLEALDAPLAAEAPAVPAAALTFHETLTKERPPAPPVPKERPAPPEPTPAQLAAAAPSPPPAPPFAATATVTSEADALADGAYTIQLGAAQDRAEAERLAARFHAYSPRIETAEVTGKGRVFRVRVGSFDTREAAARYLADVSRETGAKGWVTASR